MKNRIIALILMIATISCVFAGCTGEPEVTTNAPDTTAPVTDTESDTETEPVETEEIIVDEDPVFYEKTDKEPIDPANTVVENTDWSGTIINANEIADGVQGKFTNALREKFLITNRTSSLLYDLSSDGKKQIEGLYSKTGAAYFENSGDVSVLLPDGSAYSAAESTIDGRMNSHRLGYYYYDFRFCDQNFINAESKALAADGENSFDILANAKKWNSNDTEKAKYNDGVLSYTVKNPNDPYIHTSVTFDTAEFDAIQITIRAEASQSGSFYVAAGPHNGFTADQHVSFRFSSGKWSTVVVPLSSMPDYTGKLTKFRIDVGTEAGELIEIKELRAIKRGESSVTLRLEHVFHTYSDKMHEVVRAVADAEYTAGGVLQSQIVIPSDRVRKFVLKNENGEVSELEGFDFSTTEYVGFDVRGAGVFGIIMPAIEDNGTIKVELVDGNYVITRSKEIPEKVKLKGDVYFGHRVYTTDSHQFNDLRKEAYIERNPLKDVYIAKTADNAKFIKYDALVGCYRFTVNPSDFNKAYYREPNKHYQINALIGGDGVVDREIYIQTRESAGQLECAAILDENNSMLPIPLEVGKNFKGENEEPLFDPNDTAYGEVYVPLTIGKDECKRFTLLHLYQNWGNYPLKQLSFIAFHICYYHLSVGVTETNCIAPYFVYGKDGWTLPDFRANSAPLWSGQPQHTSAGRLYFLQYKDSAGNKNKSESQSADILSAGPVYADINMDYLSDDGKIKATYRHTEFPQNDENRTYYNIRLEVLDDVSIADFRNDFSFFTFDGRSVLYSNVGYLNENGEMITEKVKNGTRIIKLGKEYPYYDYYSGNNHDSVNFALIVMNSDITVGGKKYDGSFVFRDKYDGILNYGSLSLDLGEVTLKKGDVLQLQIILLPWGYSTSKNDSNVRGVREDSCIDPYKLTVIKGEAVDDIFVPSIKAVNGEATFRYSGGKNYGVVRVYGFEKYTAPQITAKADGKDVDFVVSSKSGYDGYQVYREADGTYSFSFVVDMSKASEYEITVKQ
ncbi:MAG: hypothetical protein J5879_10540 [Clostridia bacterium]|nr:hypothetical protein [Clostridia bacterium]